MRFYLREVDLCLKNHACQKMINEMIHADFLFVHVYFDHRFIFIWNCNFILFLLLVNNEL